MEGKQVYTYSTHNVYDVVPIVWVLHSVVVAESDLPI